MSALSDEVKRGIDKRIRRLFDQRRDLDWMDTLPESIKNCSKDVHADSSDNSTVFVYFPLNKVLMNQLSSELTAMGWDETQSGAANLIYRKGINGFWRWIFLNFEQGEEATCKLVEIGEETYTGTRKIYEVVCKDLPVEEQL